MRSEGQIYSGLSVSATEQIMLDALFDSSPVGMCFLDLELRFIRINRYLAEINGMPVDAHLGKRVSDILPSLFVTLQKVTAEILTTGLPVTDYEFSGQTPAMPGILRYWKETWFPVRDISGKIIGYGALVEEITNRKLAERQLEKANQKLQGVLNGMTDGLLMLDPQWRFTYFSEQGARMLGLKASDLLGQCIWDVFPDARESEFFRAYHHAVDSRQVVHFEEYYPAPLNIWFECHCYPNEEGLSVYFRDITDRKTVEKSLQTLAQDLKAADQKKDEFLATLAHELRNPLAAVSGAVTLMQSAKSEPLVVDECRATIERQCRQMVRLIDDLMDVSRISTNKMVLQREPVLLATIVRNAQEATHALYERSGHQLEIDLPDSPVQLNADSVRLTQVLGNLLNNACKYSDSGTTVKLICQVVENEVVIRVKDQGIGIPSEMLRRVFDLFTQVDRSLSRSDGGLGIGLSLVRRLVELHEGQVTVHSDGPGKGCEFVLRLPIVIPATVVKSEKNPAPARLNRRVLVVDDNRDSARSLSMLLKYAGCQIVTAHTGAEAVAQAEAFSPQIVLMDIGLPEMDGHQACRAIRSTESGRSMVMVALTGWGQDEDRRLSAEAGFDGHLVKPIDFNILLELLDRLEQKRRE